MRNPESSTGIRGLESGGLESGGLESGELESGGLESGGLESGELDSGGLESGIHYGLESGIHYVWIPESRKLESGIQRPGSGIQDLHGFSYMGRILEVRNFTMLSYLGSWPVSLAT